MFTGVTTPAGLLAAGPDHRPDLIADDVAGLNRPHPAVTDDGGAWRCGRWRAAGEDGVLTLTSTGPAPGEDDGLDGLRALCVAHWAARPDEGSPATVRADSPEGTTALRRWGLSSD